MVIPIIMSCSKLIFLNSFTITIGRGGETRLRRCIRLFLIFGETIDTLHHKNNSSLPKLQLLFALVAGMRLFWIIFCLDTILQRPTTKFLLPLRPFGHQPSLRPIVSTKTNILIRNKKRHHIGSP